MSSPARVRRRASSVNLHRIPQPTVVILITQESAGSPPVANAREMVHNLREKPWNHKDMLIVTATRRAVEQLENAAQINGVNVQSIDGLVAIVYQRLPRGGLRRTVVKGYEDIRNVISGNAPVNGFPARAGAGFPARAGAGSPARASGSGAGTPSSRYASASSSPSRSGAGTPSRPSSPARPVPASPSRNLVNASTRAVDLYTAFRTALQGNGSRHRTVAVLLASNGDEAWFTEFMGSINQMHQRLGKAAVGAVAHVPQRGRGRPLSNAAANVVARALAPEYARARGRAFAVLLAYATKGDPKTQWARKVMRKVFVCYTPAALARAAASLLNNTSGT